MGYVYLLHFCAVIGRRQGFLLRLIRGLGPRKNNHYRPRCQHYIGYTDDLAARMQAHRRGNGAKLVTAAATMKIDFEIARVWRGGRRLERRLKAQRNGPSLCPICSPGNRRMVGDELSIAEIKAALIPF